LDLQLLPSLSTFLHYIQNFPKSNSSSFVPQFHILPLLATQIFPVIILDNPSKSYMSGCQDQTDGNCKKQNQCTEPRKFFSMFATSFKFPSQILFRHLTNSKSFPQQPKASVSFPRTDLSKRDL
jgi:hypothetical protein